MMEYPTHLSAGTLIKLSSVKRKPYVSSKAIGLVFRLGRDIQLIDGKGIRSSDGAVVEDPNGWCGNRVVATIDLRYDKVLAVKNRSMVSLLTDE